MVIVTDRFQFLLGRLKTRSRSLPPSPKPRFQFLLGRLKTGVPTVAPVANVSEFQFLLGRLKTPAN